MQFSPGVFTPVHEPLFAFGEHWGEGLLQRFRDLCPETCRAGLSQLRCLWGTTGGGEEGGRCTAAGGRGDAPPLYPRNCGWHLPAVTQSMCLLWNLSPDHRICASSCFTIYSKIPLNWNPSINKIKIKRTLELTKQIWTQSTNRILSNAFV